MTTTEREGVGFLLIADLHLGHPDSRFSWSDYRDELERDLRREHARTGPWDIVLVARGLDHGRALPADPHAWATLRTGLLDMIAGWGSPSAVVLGCAGAQAEIVERGGLCTAFVAVDGSASVRGQLASLGHAWRAADIRVLVSADPPPPAGWDGVDLNMFRLHCTGWAPSTPTPAAFHVATRSLLGALPTPEPGTFRYGYVSGRVREFDTELRARALHEGRGGSTVFRDDPRLDGAQGGSLRLAYPPVVGEVAMPDRPSTRTPSEHVRSVGRWSDHGKVVAWALCGWSADGIQLHVGKAYPGSGKSRNLVITPGPSPSDTRPRADQEVGRTEHTGPRGTIVQSHETVVLCAPTGEETTLLSNARPQAITWLKALGQVAVAVEGELVVVDETGSLVRTLSLHDDPCRAITATADARLLASISTEGEIKLWRTSDWANVGSWRWHGGSAHADCIAFSPRAWTLAVCQTRSLELFDVDPAILQLRVQAAVVTALAKVVLVGQGRVGKTCLAERLVADAYSEQEPTHGMRFWSLPMPAEGLVPREVVLWDLGGQTEYRLLHQLFLPDTQLALVLVDPATEAYQDAREWAQRLDATAPATRPVPKLLVGTKVDNEDSPVDAAALERLATDLDVADTILTSALRSRGRSDLLAAIAANIDWETLAVASRGRVAQWLHEHLDTLRRSGCVVVPAKEVEAALPEGIDGADLITAIRQLARGGAIANTRTATGEQMLVLRVEEIERYAGSLIVAARDEPSGVPALDVRALLGAGMSFPRIAPQARLARRDECIVVDCVLEMLITHGLALLRHGQLVFPSLFQASRDRSGGPTPAVRFEFGGPVDNAYASLVTDLALTAAYGAPRMGPGSVRFSRAGLGTCGVRREGPARGRLGGLDVFFEDETEPATEFAFVCYVQEHLRRAGIDLVEHSHAACLACGAPFDPTVVDTRLANGEVDIVCQICESRTRIILRSDQARRRDATVTAKTSKQRDDARDRRQRSAATGKKLVETGAAAGGKPHWVLVLSDLHVGPETDVDTMRQTLLEDLRREGGPAPERYAALVVCGDLTNSATPKEFERAHALVGGLVRHVDGLTPANTVIVPGNHDVHWGHPGVYMPHDGPRPQGLSNDEYIEHDPLKALKLVRDESAYRASFGNFSRGIYETFYQRSYPTDPAQQVDVFDVPHVGLAFVTFNSAWNTAQHSPDSAMICDLAIGEAVERIANLPRDRLIVAVWHHPITGNEKIRNDAFVERLRGAGVRLCLHGHIHESRADRLGYVHAHRIDVVGTGSLGAPARERAESTPRLYHLLELAEDRDSLRVHTRQLTKVGGAWGPYYEWPDPNNGEQRLPYYDIVGLAR